MKIIFCEIWPKYSKKIKEKLFFQNFNRIMQKMRKNTKNPKMSKKCDNARENAIAFFKVSNYLLKTLTEN